MDIKNIIDQIWALSEQIENQSKKTIDTNNLIQGCLYDMISSLQPDQYHLKSGEMIMLSLGEQVVSGLEIRENDK